MGQKKGTGCLIFEGKVKVLKVIVNELVIKKWFFITFLGLFYLGRRTGMENILAH